MIVFNPVLKYGSQRVILKPRRVESSLCLMNFFSPNEWKIQEWVAWCICHRPVETGYLIKKINLVYDSSEVQEVQIKEVAFNLVRAFVVV